MIHYRWFWKRRPSVVIPTTSTSNYGNLIVFCKKNQVQSSFFGKQTAIGKDVKPLNENFGDTAFQKVSDVWILTNQLCLFAVIESRDVHLLTIWSPLFFPNVKNYVMLSDILLQVFANKLPLVSTWKLTIFFTSFVINFGETLIFYGCFRHNLAGRHYWNSLYLFCFNFFLLFGFCFLFFWLFLTISLIRLLCSLSLSLLSLLLFLFFLLFQLPCISILLLIFLLIAFRHDFFYNSKNIYSTFFQKLGI